jgi:hypothetical protein
MDFPTINPPAIGLCPRSDDEAARARGLWEAPYKQRLAQREFGTGDSRYLPICLDIWKYVEIHVQTIRQ